MSYKVTMTRSNADHSVVILQEYSTEIPMHVIAYLSLIEKKDWMLFRDSGYTTWGEFIYHHLSRYRELTPYITKRNCSFEFTYELITDSSELVHTSYYLHDAEITEQEYQHHAQGQYYFERWVMVNEAANTALIFFECEYVPS